MTLPTIAYLLQEFFDGRDDRRMPYPDSRQTFDIGQPGQLVQVVGQSFQQVEYRTVFLLYPLLHSPIGDELPHDLDGLLTRLPGQSLEPEM